MIYGIRPTLGLALLTMVGTIGLGALLGIMAGYFRGVVEEVIMRVVDVMLSFPSQIMVFAVVALAGRERTKRDHCKCLYQVGLVCPYDSHGCDGSTVTRILWRFSRCVGIRERFILFRTCCRPSPRISRCWRRSMWAGRSSTSRPCPSSAWVCRHPPRNGAPCSTRRKKWLASNPTQMLAPGIALVALVCCFNLMGDALRDVLDPKEVEK